MDIAELGYKIQSQDAVTADRRLGRLEGTSTRLETRVGSLVRSVGALGAAFGAAFSLSASIAQARQLDAAIGELSTLIPGATRDLNAMAEASRNFGASFGTGARAQAQAFYAAVSAGATDSAAAIARVDAANRLAIGGVASLGSSVAILSSATNAYASEGLSAADASDTLFVGVRTGVTTIEQLSAGLGRAIPIASALGIGFDELVGSVAALTTQGQSTELAVTGIRAALNATLQPSQQAAELARQLGIEFNSAAVESMGFLGFMEHVAERTGGNRDALTRLFGSVEAGTAVLSLAGQGGVKFNEIMGQMADRAGAADEAYDQMAQRLSTRWNVILSTASQRAEDLGTAMLERIVPAAEEVIKVLSGAEDASLALEVAMKLAAATAGVLMVQAVGSAAASMIAASAATGIWWTALQLLTVQGGAAIVVTQALTAATRLLLGPVGLAITAIGLLTAAWVTSSNGARDAARAVEDATASLDESETVLNRIRTRLGENVIGEIGEQARTAVPWVQQLAEEMNNVTAEMLSQAIAQSESDFNDITRQILSTRDDIAGVRASLDDEYARIGRIEAMRAGLRGGEVGRAGLISLGQRAEETDAVRGLEAALAGLQTRLGDLESARIDLGQLDFFEYIQAARDALADIGDSGGSGGGLTSTAKSYERVVEGLQRSVTELQYARGIEREIVSNLMAAGLSADDRTSDAARQVVELTEALASANDSDVLADFNRDMANQNLLLRVNERQRESLRIVLALEGKTLGDLTAAERMAIMTRVEHNQALQDQRAILDEIQRPAEQYRTTIAAITALLAQGTISQDMFNQRLREAQSNMLQASVDSGEASWIDGILAGLDQVAMKSTNVAAVMRDTFSSVFSTISSGVGNAIGRAIVYAEDLGDALLNVAATAVSQLIASFVELGVQWLVNQAIGQSVAAAATAASVAQATTVAAAWAPAAAAVSLASFGANSVPAMAGMTAAFALSSALSAFGGLPGLNSGGSIMVGGAGGIDNNLLSINGSPVARVGQGERIDVIPRSAVNDNSGGGITVNVGTINAGSDVSREEVYAAVREGSERAVVQATSISARDTNGKLERLARPQISAGRG